MREQLWWVGRGGTRGGVGEECVWVIGGGSRGGTVGVGRVAGGLGCQGGGRGKELRGGRGGGGRGGLVGGCMGSCDGEGSVERGGARRLLRRRVRYLRLGGERAQQRGVMGAVGRGELLGEGGSGGPGVRRCEGVGGSGVAWGWVCVSALGGAVWGRAPGGPVWGGWGRRTDSAASGDRFVGGLARYRKRRGVCRGVKGGGAGGGRIARLGGRSEVLGTVETTRGCGVGVGWRVIGGGAGYGSRGGGGSSGTVVVCVGGAGYQTWRCGRGGWAAWRGGGAHRRGGGRWCVGGEFGAWSGWI